VSGDYSESCIIAQFNRLVELNDEERQLLAALERDPGEYPAGASLIRVGDRNRPFFTLKSGWACAVRELADGQRQVLDIFLPGQVMGLREIGFDRSMTEIHALTDITACPFPRQRLTEIFDRSPRLTDLFFLLLAREQSMLVERVVNIGRRNAVQRLAHFIVELKVRLQLDSNELELPMNQAIIGDTLSLSAVHVSRTFRELRKMGLIETDNGTLGIRDFDGLIELATFDRAYLDCDANWARQG
jgi:CRP-like cAMP-binding protein